MGKSGTRDSTALRCGVKLRAHKLRTIEAQTAKAHEKRVRKRYELRRGAGGETLGGGTAFAFKRWTPSEPEGSLISDRAGGYPCKGRGSR